MRFALRCLGRRLFESRSTGETGDLLVAQRQGERALEDSVDGEAGPFRVAGHAPQQAGQVGGADRLHAAALQRGEVPVEQVLLVGSGALRQRALVLPRNEHGFEGGGVLCGDTALDDRGEALSSLTAGFGKRACLERRHRPALALRVVVARDEAMRFLASPVCPRARRGRARPSW